MLVQANKIDVDGFIIEPVIVLPTDVLQSDMISVPVPDGFYKPKWTGTEWVEGATQEYIDQVNNPPNQELSEFEKMKEEQKMTSLAVLELAEMILGG